MNCRKCGAILMNDEVECPFCGTSTVGKPVVAKQVSTVKHKPVRSKTANKQVSAEMMVKFMCASLAMLMILSISSLIMISKAKENEYANYQSMNSRLQQIDANYAALAETVNELGNSVGSVKTTLNEQETSKNITITKQPTSTATYLGRGSSSDNIQNVAIFRVNAEGSKLSFTWQRCDLVSGNWVNIQFGEDSNNYVYGLHLYTDADNGYSELCAHDVTVDEFAPYRCMIQDQYGCKYTDTVLLSEREKEE